MKKNQNKKLYVFYGDYGNYLLDKKIRTNPKITELISIAANKGFLFNAYRAYQCYIDYYDFEEIMQDYDKASTTLDFLLDEIVFEKLSLSYFIIFMGYLIKYSKSPDKIISKYLIYVKEINDFINSVLFRIDKENEEVKDKEYYYAIKAYIFILDLKE